MATAKVDSGTQVQKPIKRCKNLRRRGLAVNTGLMSNAG
jgi:hypothetical protein